MCVSFDSCSNVPFFEDLTPSKVQLTIGGLLILGIGAAIAYVLISSHISDSASLYIICGVATAAGAALTLIVSGGDEAMKSLDSYQIKSIDQELPNIKLIMAVAYGIAILGATTYLVLNVANFSDSTAVYMAAGLSAATGVTLALAVLGTYDECKKLDSYRFKPPAKVQPIEEEKTDEIEQRPLLHRVKSALCCLHQVFKDGSINTL